MRYTYNQLVMGQFEDVDPTEAAYALEVMANEGHDIAHFGINGCFLFSEVAMSKDELDRLLN
jgi:hypothetical protein